MKNKVVIMFSLFLFACQITQPITPDCGKKTSNEELFQLWDIPPLHRLAFNDVYYVLYPKKLIQQQIYKIPIPRKYEIDFWDCDDIARWYKAHLRHQMPGLPVATIIGATHDHKQAHSWLEIPTLEGDVLRYFYIDGHINIYDVEYNLLYIIE